MKYWLMKSEPDVYSIEDMERDGTEYWEGVRNYQARNFMRDMAEGDLVLFYHSNAKPPGVVGVVKVEKEAYPDPTQFDETSPYFDKKQASKETAPEEPRWSTVDVTFVSRFSNMVTLETLREQKALEEMHVVKRGSRLSVTPVKKKEFVKILKLANTSLEAIEAL